MPSPLKNLLLVTIFFTFLACTVNADPCPVAYLPADINGDCHVDTGDILLIAQQWLEQSPVGGELSADISGDDKVNFLDFGMMSEDWMTKADIVINEIHYDPNVQSDLVEFVELYNNGDMPVDMGNWYFSDGLTYTFPAGTILDPDKYLVVGLDPSAILAKFGVSCLGPFVGKLSNEGEAIVLRNAEGQKVD